MSGNFFEFGRDDFHLVAAPKPMAEIVAFPLDQVKGNRYRAIAIARKIAYLLPDAEAAKEVWVDHVAKVRAALAAQGLPCSSIDAAVASYTAKVRELIALERAGRK